MKIRLGTLLAAACLPAPSLSAPPRPSVKAALARIHTITGQNALERVRACGIGIERRKSQVSRTRDGYDLYVRVDIPNRPGDDFRLIALGWAIVGDHARPTTDWAAQIQDRPAPLGAGDWLNC